MAVLNNPACAGLYDQGVDLFRNVTARKYRDLCNRCPDRAGCQQLVDEMQARGEDVFGLWAGKFYYRDGRRNGTRVADMNEEIRVGRPPIHGRYTKEAIEARGGKRHLPRSER